MSKHSWMVGLVAVMLSALQGCGGGSGTPVSGTVVRDGEPVPHGVITFATEEGPTVTLPIEEGRFSSAQSDVGMMPGPNSVAVEYPPADDPGGESPNLEYETQVTIPEEGTSDLTIDVTDEPAGDVDF